MSMRLYALTHGLNGLMLGYVLIWIAMLVGLHHRQASPQRFLWSPVTAIPTMVLASTVVSIQSALVSDSFADSILQTIVGSALCVWVGYISGRIVAVWGDASGLDHRRGAVVSSQEVPAAASRDPSDPNVPITLAGHTLDLQDEMKHFKLIGTTGTGKSTAIRELLTAALARGDRAIIADPDGGYLDTFYDQGRGDVILNPFTFGSSKWSLFGEINRDYDVDQLARALIPDSHDPDSTWIDYSRTFFTALVQQSIAAGQTDDAELLRMIVSASQRELALLLTNTPAAPLLATGNDKMLSAVRTINASALRALKYTSDQEGPAFSVRRWVSEGRSRLEGGQGGVLFLPYMAVEIAALRSTISAWMRIAIFEAMSTGEADHRLWFVIDELDALGEIDGLKDALARVRKFGGRCVLGLQSISQVSGTYKAAAHAIVENCGNTIIFRCSASEHGGTSEFASKLIGQREVVHTTRSKTRAPGAWRASTTTSESIKIEPAVMASEIERLPDLQGFLKIAALPDWRRVTFIRPDASTAPGGRRPTPPPAAAGASQPANSASQPVANASQPATTTAAAGQPSPPTRRAAKPAKAVSRKRPRKPRTRPLTPSGLPSTPKSGEQLPPP
jgi:Type IV secretion-system coupling protein DNA-binding domain